MISAGTRESEQPRMIAKGSCATATSRRRDSPATTLPLRVSDTNRWFPARRRSRASLAGIIWSPLQRRLRILTALRACLDALLPRINAVERGRPVAFSVGGFPELAHSAVGVRRPRDALLGR